MSEPGSVLEAFAVAPAPARATFREPGPVVKTSSSSRHGSSEVEASTVKRSRFATAGAKRSTVRRGFTAGRNGGRPATRFKASGEGPASIE